MRFRFALLGLVFFACGNHEEPQAPSSVASTTPSATASASATPVVSASASASAAPSASAVVEAPPPGKPLKDVLTGAKTIQLVWREKLDSKEGLTITIKTDSTIKAIVNAIGGDQIPQGGVPGTMTTFVFTFQDATGKMLGAVGLSASATMSESNKKYGRLDLPDNTHAGIVVADYAELQKRLKALSVNLP